MLPKSEMIFNAIIAPASTTFKAVLRDSRVPTIVELDLCKRFDDHNSNSYPVGEANIPPMVNSFKYIH